MTVQSHIRLLLLLVLSIPAMGYSETSTVKCLDLQKHGRSVDAQRCFNLLALSADPEERAEGFWGLELWSKANDAFRLAVNRPGSKSSVKVRWGRLLHDRFNDQEAHDLFTEAIKQNPADAGAYLGLAVVSADGFDPHAADDVRRALMLDATLVEAHEFLANLNLENQNVPAAMEEANEALALSAEALQALAVRAAIEILGDGNPDPWFAKIHDINPSDGRAFALVGYHLVLNRRYDDGVSYFRKAIRAEPSLWAAHSQLGINLMRLGKETEPMQELQLAYEHGQRDPATVNSLRLLESYKNFITVSDQTTVLKLRKSEAALLQPYFADEMHLAIARYHEKYQVTLAGPVQLEVYPDHEDFAVRTMGMPGLGALGVTFGDVVAMDSPSGRKPGEFNWGSTMWHELSHVYILTATRHRVPRWFTEGLAVHEEGQVHAEWANRLTPEVLVAIREKKLLPLESIDRGFIFPEYPAQISVTYFQAGSICDFIQQKWGDNALLGMVHSFADLQTTPEAVKTNLKVSSGEFDKLFLTWLQSKVGSRPADFERWRAGVKEIAEAVQANQNDVVLRQAPGIIALYPEYVGDGNPYEGLAAAQLSSGDKKSAQLTLAAYANMGGEDPPTLSRLALLQEQSGDDRAAARTLNLINYIYPEDENLHRHLGKLWLAQGNSAGAVREFVALLALNPTDKADAHFNLAQAYLASGNKDKAEENVLAALEIAPGFKPAQKLLVQIEAGK